MLRAIFRALRRVLSHLGKGMHAALGFLFGSGSAPGLPTSEFEELVDEQVQELREDLAAAPPKDASFPEPLGHRIHAYASGDREARDTFDFDGIPEHVAVALLVMPPEQLCRLAAAGPAVCARWARGEARTGLVGVPLPDPDFVKQQAPDAGAAPAETACATPAPATAALAA